jgi:hypothetical protein
MADNNSISIPTREATGIPHETLRSRIERGWSADRALSTPIHIKDPSRQC